jgi:hypothetical protein
MNSAELVDFNNLLSSLKISSEKISFQSEGSIDTILIYPRFDSKISKLEKNLKQIGLIFRSKSEPIGYYDYSAGCYKIELRRRGLQVREYSEICNAIPTGEVPLLLGMAANGSPLSVDLGRLPNLLIAGVPGSGKSMLLHSLVLSIIRSEANIHLCDPKMVEFSRYAHIKNVRTVTHGHSELQDVLSHLNNMMFERYSKYQKSGCADIKEYRRLKDSKEKYECLVIDEWADIVLSNPKIIDQIVTLAQKGRAAGILLVLATQRPSAKVFPGLIKASFPGRIALRTASSMESRIILDKNGAENLDEIGSAILSGPISSSDILFKTPWFSNLTAYINKQYPEPFFNFMGLNKWKI